MNASATKLVLTYEEIHQGWVRISKGDARVTISPRGIIHPAKVFHGEEDHLIACLREAKKYVTRHVVLYKRRGVPW